jgi:hypothetical protein
MVDVIDATYIDGYVLELKFENGKKGRLDFSDYMNKGGVFARLAELSYFKQFYINKELGVLCWPDGQDIAPETLYHAVTGEPLPAWMTEREGTLTKS